MGSASAKLWGAMASVPDGGAAGLAGLRVEPRIAQVSPHPILTLLPNAAVSLRPRTPFSAFPRWQTARVLLAGATAF